MNQSTKWVIGVVVVVAIVAIGYGMSKSPSGPVSTGPIKIGVMGPFTGDGATYGEPFRNMVQLAVEEINAAGGVNNRTLEVVYEDDKCTGATASSAIQKLVNVDKVRVVLGGVCSSATIPAAPIAAAAKAALFSPAASSPDLTGISPFFFRDYPSDASQGMVLAQLASDKNWKNVAFLQEQKDYPLGIRKAFQSQFESLGGKIVVEEFPPESTDFRTSLSKLKSIEPDVLFLSLQTVAPLDRILKQLQELKWNPQLMLSDAVLGDAATVLKYKDVLEGAFGAEFGTDPNNPKFQHMLEAYKTKYGTDVPYQSYAQTEYDAVYIIRDALLANGNDGEKIAAWSRTIKNWDGASGKVTIGQNGDRIGGHVAKIIKDGKVELYNSISTSAPSAQ